MRNVVLSFTLRSPGQNYDLVELLIWACSTRYIWRDESEYRIETSVSDTMLKLLFGFALDVNDRLNIYSITSDTGINQTTNWKNGGFGTSKARELIQKVRQLAVQVRRAS